MYRARRVARACYAAVVVCAALGLTSCSVEVDNQKSGDSEVPAGLEKYYSQRLDWKNCEDVSGFSTGIDQIDTGLDGLECAWLEVPMDYEDPSGATIEIAVARSVAKNSQGSLVINPGGPGGSGVEMVPDVAGAGGTTLVGALDVVGFDPRGVSRSAPVDCLDDAEMDAYLGTDDDLSTEAGLEEARARVAAFVEGCQERTGPVLAHVDTISSARDVDVLRAALGEDTLTYLGVSYGTKLGATYAQLFPDKVGRMVLDGAMDVTLTLRETDVDQAGGFDSALRAYVEDCLASAECPLSGSTDEAMAQVAAVIDQARVQPMATPLNTESTGENRVLTGALAKTGIDGAMYSENLWPILTQALQLAIHEQDGSLLVVLADLYNFRCDGMFRCSVDNGYFANVHEANPAIDCIDYVSDTDPQALADQAQDMVEAAPVFGRFQAERVAAGLLPCAIWPYSVGPLPSYEAKGAAPIVVIGTTSDPATPHAWAQVLADTLESGVLVTNEAEGHGGYVGGKECIQTAVDEYLVNGKVPEDGMTC